MSSKTFRLPEMLGGREMKAHHYRADQSAGFYVEGEVVWVPLALLTEVTPPLPEEPPVGSVVIVGADPLKLDPLAGYVYRRYHDVWCAPGDHGGLDWAQVCMAGTPVRLIPAPVVEPVTLPWTSAASLGRRVTVNVLGGGPLVSIEEAGGTYPTTCHVNAGEMARALMAADAAERAS